MTHPTLHTKTPSFKTLVTTLLASAALIACGGGGEEGLYTTQANATDSSAPQATSDNASVLAEMEAVYQSIANASKPPIGQYKPGMAPANSAAKAKANNVAGFIIKYKTASANAALQSAAEGADISATSLKALSAVANKHGINLKSGARMFNGARSLHLQERINIDQAQAIMAEIKAADSNIALIEPDRVMRAAFVPNDTFFASEQWHYQAGTGGINLPTAWDTAAATRGSGVNVAVIDTGYTNHPDLLANIVGGYDFISNPITSRDGGGRDANASDPGDWNDISSYCEIYNSSWHGTHVAGTIAAVTNNSTGVAGVAFNAKVVPIRVLGRCGGTDSDIADAIAWAAGATVSGVPANPHPAKVINLSLGGEGSCSSTTQAAINQAIARGATVVVAAGNDADDVANYSPANCKGVITVSATTKFDLDASYSNYGTGITLAAPGGERSAIYGCTNGVCDPGRGATAVDRVMSTLNNGTTVPGTHGYVEYQGTSMAAPHVAGVAALLLAHRPTLTNADIELILKKTARPYPADCPAQYCTGAGILDAAAALALDPATITTKPVYRFFHGPSSSYFLTISSFERNNIMLNYPAFFYEGPQFSALVTSQPNSSPVYRFRNIQNGSYFWTISQEERNSIAANYKHQFIEEDIGWYANQSVTNNWLPLYRFRDVNNTYLFTSSEAEKQSLLTTYSNRFIPESTAYYVLPLN